MSAVTGPGSLFSASCVRFVLTSYTKGNTKEAGSAPVAYCVLVICNCVETQNCLMIKLKTGRI